MATLNEGIIALAQAIGADVKTLTDSLSDLPLNAVTSDVGITKIWAGTQAAYDALTKDPTTLYVITED